MSTVHLLFRQDPAMRVLPRGIITALCLGLLFRIEPDLAHGLDVLDVDRLPGGFGPMYLFSLLLVLLFVLSGNAWTRTSRISAALPLSTRATWLVRTASLVAVAVSATLTLTLFFGLSLGPAGLLLNPVIALTALRATATLILLILLYQLPLSEQDRIPITPEYVIYLVFVTLIVVGFSTVEITSLAGSTFFLVLSFALGLWLYVRTPRTWSVGPSVEESAEPVWSSDASRPSGEDAGSWDRDTASRPRRPATTVNLAVFRGLTNTFQKWLILTGIAGAMLVVTLEFYNGTNAFLALILVTVWHLPVLQMSLERMTPFDALPISRRKLWIHAIGPAALAMLVGVLSAQLIRVLDPSKSSPIRTQGCCVKVPWEYYEIAPDGIPPTITAPWGESITPAAETLWRGTRVALYDPYEISAESSPRFAEYQVRRAVAAIYGVPMEPERASFGGGTMTTGSTDFDLDALILELARDKKSDGRSRSVAVTLMLFTVVMLVLLVPALCQYGSSVHRKIFKWASWGALIFVGVLFVAVAAARLAGYAEPWYLGAVASIGIRHLAARMPVPTGMLWILFVTFWLGAYLLLGRVFSRIELPGRSIVNRFAEEY